MVGILLLGSAVYAIAQENITMTTYYPSPRGVYDQLRARLYQDFDAIGPPNNYQLDLDATTTLNVLTLTGTLTLPAGLASLNCPPTGCVDSPDIIDFNAGVPGSGIQTVDLGDDAVTTAKIQNFNAGVPGSGIQTVDLGDDAVTSAKIQNDAVQSVDIQNFNAGVPGSGIQTVDLGDDAVTTAKILVTAGCTDVATAVQAVRAAGAGVICDRPQAVYAP